MRLSIEVELDYLLEADDPPLLALTAAQGGGQDILHSEIETGDATLAWVEDASAPGLRAWIIGAGERFRLVYRAAVLITRSETPLEGLAAAALPDLPPGLLPYLRPSRYCPSDLLAGFAERRFGHLEGGARIAAIRDWTAEALSYVPGASDATTTAVDTFTRREGVCRDYAHLVCALARAGNIPARYTSGYSPGVTPPDFHAVAEVWLGGAWHVVDATGMCRPSDLAVIGSGRDAGDMAFMETVKPARPITLRVAVNIAG